MSVGAVFAQDEGAPPSSGLPDQGQAQSYPDQSGQQYPDQAQQSYPNQYPDQGAQQQPYPSQGGQQGYPPQNGQTQQQDPPGRVARMQYMSGQVSIQPGGVNDWIAASNNRPLTSSDRVWTDKNSRAELNVGDGFIRMNSETSLTLTNVTDQNIQLELDQGTLNLTVKHLERGEIYEVDTPNYAFTVMKPGVYRFDVYPNEDQSWVTVRSGYGEATGKGAAVRVNSGEQMRFSNGNSLVHTAENAPGRDGFDDWVQVRDKRLDSSLSAQYVSPGVIGYQDLDQYGRWQPTPNYGNVWVPYSVPAGWAPYRFGHWVWIAPWGWTWVDNAPWGFAPFHYGRWVNWGGGWAWAPGPVGYWQPYYAPALVGWIGGPGFGVGFGFGGGGWGININFGWFPLGWGEPFFPHYCGWGHGGWYRGGGWVSPGYLRAVNVTNIHVTNINNINKNYYNGTGVTNARYGFRNTPGAVTAAPRSAFTSGAAINRVGGAVPAADLGKGSMLRGVSATPTRESVLGGASAARGATPPASAFSRSVVTSGHTPTATRPASLTAANQATLSHGNLNALAEHGPATSARTGATAPTNARLGAPANASRGEATTNAGRGASTGGMEARNSVPTAEGGHYVPRPPSAGGLSSHSNIGSTSASAGRVGSMSESASASRNVPRPPAANDSFARPGSSTAYGATRSPQSAQVARGYSAGQTSRYGARSASASVPRPPSNYAYHAAPAGSYGASSRGYSSPSYGSRSYSAAPTYSARSYGSPSGYSSRGSAPTYTARNYGASPAYSGRGYSSPSYSSRNYSAPSRSYSAPSSSGRSYSAPRSSGGGYHGGGGGSHGGGGGHSGGGHR